MLGDLRLLNLSEWRLLLRFREHDLFDCWTRLLSTHSLWLGPLQLVSWSFRTSLLGKHDQIWRRLSLALGLLLNETSLCMADCWLRGLRSGNNLCLAETFESRQALLRAVKSLRLRSYFDAHQFLMRRLVLLQNVLHPHNQRLTINFDVSFVDMKVVWLLKPLEVLFLLG